jgi:hypothetical protein
MYALWLPDVQRFAFRPNDNGGVLITIEYFITLFEGQSAGGIITADENGYPVVVYP